MEKFIIILFFLNILLDIQMGDKVYMYIYVYGFIYMKYMYIYVDM